MFLILLLILLGVIFYLMYQKGTFPVIENKKETALDILHKRFASGEISDEEYYEKKKTLEDR